MPLPLTLLLAREHLGSITNSIDYRAISLLNLNKVGSMSNGNGQKCLSLQNNFQYQERLSEPNDICQNRIAPWLFKKSKFGANFASVLFKFLVIICQYHIESNKGDWDKQYAPVHTDGGFCRSLWSGFQLRCCCCRCQSQRSKCRLKCFFAFKNLKSELRCALYHGQQ